MVPGAFGHFDRLDSVKDAGSKIVGMKILERVLDRLLTAPDETPGEALVKPSSSRKPASFEFRVTTTSTMPSSVTKSASSAHATVYILLDVSQSMDEDKLAQARKGGTAFAKDAIGRGYEVGVIQFTTWTHLRTKPTKKLGEIRAGLSEVRAQATTNMGGAIRRATRELAAIRGTRAMVLVTDGYPDSAEAALEAANEAKKKDITIIAIGTEDADRDFLNMVATARELATTVPDRDLGQTLAKAAGLLPANTSR